MGGGVMICPTTMGRRAAQLGRKTWLRRSRTHGQEFRFPSFSGESLAARFLCPQRVSALLEIRLFRAGT